MPARLLRTIGVSVALAIVVGTGVAWGTIRSFESGINHITSGALGEGGEDGAIDVLLVGMDSRTDAHGNPLTEEELATLRAGDDEVTNTDTIILVRIPNNGESATAISIPRDSYVETPDMAKTKINGVYGEAKFDTYDPACRGRRHGSGRGGAEGGGGRPRGADQDRRQTHRRHRRPLRRDRPARLFVDHRRPGRRQCLPERGCLRTAFGCGFLGRLAETGRPAGAELRPAAP